MNCDYHVVKDGIKKVSLKAFTFVAEAQHWLCVPAHKVGRSPTPATGMVNWSKAIFINIFVNKHQINATPMCSMNCYDVPCMRFMI